MQTYRITKNGKSVNRLAATKTVRSCLSMNLELAKIALDGIPFSVLFAPSAEAIAAINEVLGEFGYNIEVFHE